MAIEPPKFILAVWYSFKSKNMTKRRTFITLSVLALSLLPLHQALAQPIRETPNAAQSTAASQKLEFMFVQTAEDLKVNPDQQTLRLVNVNQQTLYFTDRPQRIAGNLTMAAYLDEWTAREGADNFTNDPPNATLSVYEAGNPVNKLAVVEISHPVIDGKDLVYSYKLIEGTMPNTGGQTSLFIDWIGVGGGVGPGFYGVGAGTRGAGVYGGYGGPARVVP